MRYIGIDPSTKTGFVALDEKGNVVRAKELTGVGAKDPKRMATMIDDIMAHIHQDDLIVIEGFGYASQQAVQNGGIGWGIRMELFKRGFNYFEVAPNAVKKYVNVSGWVGEEGHKQRLKDKEKKQAVIDAVLKHYRFTHQSNNIVDAYIMAQIAYEISNEQKDERLDLLPIYQHEVLQQILNPAPKTKKKGGNKGGSKTKAAH